MFKRFKEKLDHWAINAGYATLAEPHADPEQRDELEKILAQDDFFVPKDVPADLVFTNRWQFEAESSVKVLTEQNNRIHGWFLKAGKRWQEKPLLIFVHGWNAELHYQMVLPRAGRKLIRKGINAVAFELPLHSQRRPGANEKVRNFISDNVPVMLQATRQSIADMHSILLWAKSEGCPKVAVWGFSLGGWLSGMYGTLKADAAALVLTTPIISMSDAIASLAFCKPVRSALAVAPMQTDFLDLPNRQVQLAPDAILLQEAEYDQFIPRGTYKELAEKWGTSNGICSPQSHISILLSSKAMQAGVDWLAKRLGVA